MDAVSPYHIYCFVTSVVIVITGVVLVFILSRLVVLYHLFAVIKHLIHFYLSMLPTSPPWLYGVKQLCAH